MPRFATRRRALTLGVTAVAVLGPALAAFAQAGTETAEVGTAAEAWYQPAPAPAAPAPVPPVPSPPPAPAPSIYPPGTLHVGVTAGVEDSRTYVQLDLSALTFGTVPVGGLVTLPIAGSDAGTRAPETAKVRLCLVTGEVVDGVEGDTGAPPAIDCTAAQSPAAFVPAADPAPAVLTADLTPFAAAWAAGAPMQGLAVVPAEGVPPNDAWHVAFSQRDRMAEGARPITASVSFSSSSSSSSSSAAGTGDALSSSPSGDSSFGASSPGSDLSFGSGSGSGSDFGSGSGFASPPSSDFGFVPAPDASLPDAVPPTQPEIAEPTEQPASQPVAAPAFFSVGGFAYPAVFLLPLLFAAAIAWAGRALTRDLLPARDAVAG